MNKQTLIVLAVGIAAGYFFASTLAGYPVYSTVASFATRS